MTEKNSVEDETRTESKRVQMNLNVSPETKEMIREEAKTRYGSEKKMGHALDEMAEEWAGTDDSEMKDMVSALYDEIVEGGTKSTHTGGTTHSTGVDDDLLNAIESGEVNREEYDLTQLKGESGTLVRDAILGVLRNEGQQTYSKKEIQTLVETELGYSINAARNKRDAVLAEMVDVNPDISDEIEQALRNEFEADLWKPINGNSEWAVSRDLDSPIQTWLNKYSSMDDYLPLSLKGGEGYALPEQADKFDDIQQSQLSFAEEDAIEDGDLHLVYRIQTVAMALGYMDTRTVSVDEI